MIISFKDRSSEIEGFYALLRGKTVIQSGGEHKYIITDEQCNLLKQNKIEYTVERNL